MTSNNKNNIVFDNNLTDSENKSLSKSDTIKDVKESNLVGNIDYLDNKDIDLINKVSNSIDRRNDSNQIKSNLFNTINSTYVNNSIVNSNSKFYTPKNEKLKDSTLKS